MKISYMAVLLAVTGVLTACAFNSQPISQEEKKSTGEIVYNIFCENKYTKGIAKYALTRTIKTLVSSVATPVVGGVAGVIASDVYDDVCEYYK